MPPHDDVATRHGINDREADHPVDGERVEARAQASRTQLEQDAFGRLGGDDSVQYSPGHSGAHCSGFDDEGVGNLVVQTLPRFAEDEERSMIP